MMDDTCRTCRHLSRPRTSRLYKTPAFWCRLHRVALDFYDSRQGVQPRQCLACETAAEFAAECRERSTD